MDLGYWNHVKLAGSDDRLAKSLAAFKTPTLRGLAATSPYMHNGAYISLESVIVQKALAADSARAGTLRNPDPELFPVALELEDIPYLFAFLNTLNASGARGARLSAGWRERLGAHARDGLTRTAPRASGYRRY